MKTFTETNYRGDKSIITDIDNLFTDPTQVLRISTRKNDRGYIVTSASVHRVKDNCLTFIMFQDFRQTLSEVKARATLGNLQRQHDKVLQSIEDVIDRAITFYS